ncbi:MAG: branched-chain amino acid aminotransferase [Ectothiorhodospiraceae bacterium AqS1]|nr:branched-chain amino acid aminotransferase [Ectothiorhodospiraceae bacterium AqS1]
MEFRIEIAPPEIRRPKPTDESALGFGRIYSDHMFTMRWTEQGGWTDPTVRPFSDLKLSPASLVLHYSQTIFEGLKAYRNPKGNVNLFRPKDNAARFNQSAARVDLPQVDPAIFMKAIEQLVELDHEWIPRSSGTSLYIRPTMIATEPYIGLKSAHEVLFFIITGPVGAYYQEGFNPVNITVCDRYSRAGPGGLGSIKAGANYAASLKAEKEAASRGFSQVLWLDAAERKFIEEVGSMNILFMISGTVVTPPPGDTILDGITKASVLELLRDWGVPVEERRLTIGEVVGAQKSGLLEEVFGAGTAAVISPVGSFEYQGEVYHVKNGGTGKLTKKLFDELTRIQYKTCSEKPDRFGWVHEIALSSPQS